MDTQRRPSSFRTPQQEQLLKSAEALKLTLENSNLQLLRNEQEGARDPAIVTADVTAQISFLRKLKFQFLEQNAKDRYVKSIVSDVHNAPIVTAEDNKELLVSNSQKKERLKVVKSSLEEMQEDIRTLAPLVETVKDTTSEASILTQKIIDARLSITRSRKTHPHPRLTISLADQKLMDQVEEMQTLNDELDNIYAQVQAVKEQVKRGALELEALHAERAEVA